MVRRFFSDEISKSSAELSYYLLFSAFPVLLLIGSVLSIVQFSQVTVLRMISMLPTDFQRIIGPMVTRYLGQVSQGTLVGRIIMLSLMVIYFLSRTMSSLMRNVNRIYRIPNRRGGVGQLLFEVFTAFGFVMVLFLSAILLILGRSIYTLVNHFVEIPQQFRTIWNYGRYSVAFGVIFLFLLVLAYLAPNCVMRMRDALPGTIFTLITWIVCTLAFTFYVNHINRYDALYGSLSAIMVLLLWMYMTGIIVYLGFEFNHIMMQRNHRNFVCKGKPWYIRLVARIFPRDREKENET